MPKQGVKNKKNNDKDNEDKKSKLKKKKIPKTIHLTGDKVPKSFKKP